MLVERLSSWNRRITIEYPEETVRKKTVEVLERFSKRAKLPGFRQGKIPREVIEMHFKKEIMEDVKNELLTQGYREAVQGNQIEPVSDPAIESIEFDNGNGLRAVMTVQVKPPVNLKDYKFLKIAVRVVSVTDEEVEAELHALRKKFALLKPVTDLRPAVEGDYILADIIERIPGKKPEHLKDTLIKPGSGTALREIEQGIIGMKNGDTKTINFRFPEEIEDKSIAGKEATYTIKLKEIKEEILPEIDDHFASTVGNFQSLEELKNMIRKRIEEVKNFQRDNDVRRELLKQLVKRNEVDAPPAMIEREMNYIYSSLVERGLLPPGQSNETIMKKIREEAELQVDGRLIIEEIARREGITVSDEEIVRFVERLARAERKNLKEVEHIFESPQASENIRAELLEEKVMKMLSENARIEDKSSILWTPGSEMEAKR